MNIRKLYEKKFRNEEYFNICDFELLCITFFELQIINECL